MRTDIHSAAGYRLSFQCLDEPEEAYAFPCDVHGHVDLDALSRNSFNDYLYARALVGMQFKAPSIRRNGALSLLVGGPCNAPA